ncbi:MAG: ABC transporter permease subunit [Deltaproteobacteria bacterium]|jgi:ABC-2 type transport system permease protein|nr:ABC transporter permease subunit [Deltaproteobacteria bacterium]MBW2536457.1 ABC transporter permease subunit [Deltaproteobacteria bacterium]
MSNVLLIARRELMAYVRSPLGYVVAAAVLLIDGIWFMAKALGPAGGKQLSAAVLGEFFHGATGTTMIACLVLSMRLVAHEQEHGTLVLLRTSPIRDRDVVVGKFLSVMLVMSITTALTVYMPLLVAAYGKVSTGHIVVGYVGLLLLASASIAIGLFASTLARSQVIAAIVGAALLGTMLLLWLLARQTEPPINEFIEGLALHHARQRPFMQGLLRLENVVYYLAVTFAFLVASIKTLEARRWR